MIYGTGKQRKCYPVLTISEKLGDNVRRNILGFHALIGFDTTSAVNGISKKTAWVKYIAHPDTLKEAGRDGDALAVSTFLCVLYGCCKDHPPNIDTCRYRLFLKARKSLDLLPS
ncbi:hypothetical protein DPMN_036598 [Dreissena polymorpha]|uniref:Uncharacterized protein n=1 Tax=Dreissena polymorpha TaxID=45954 RepID=A0A9D4MBU2_DREPO|nr:hypothetical protein DPMN_036598 [Dreissena polymorpha]